MSDELPFHSALPGGVTGPDGLSPTGLNVLGMLKHDTLVLTVAAAERVQERLLRALSLHDSMALKHTDATLLR